MVLGRVLRTLRQAARERFVQPHYHAYIRQNHGSEQRVVLPKGELDEEFVADPFLFRHAGETYLFFEGMRAGRGNRGRNKGVIGCLRQVGDAWVNCGIVLEEAWHLSFPHIFEADGRVYMIPESGQSGAVSLYESIEFPTRWAKRCDLIQGDCNYVDAALILAEGVYYLSVTPSAALRRPELWLSERLEGPWMKHPQSDNVSDSLALRRNGGAFICENGQLYRIAQDCDGAYGKRIFRVPVTVLSRTQYAEGNPEEMSSVIGWPQPLPCHTYNREVNGLNVLEVVDRHYYTVKTGGALLSAAFWYGVDSLTYFFRKARPATMAS